VSRYEKREVVEPEKIQTRNPGRGKKGVRIEKSKYDIIRALIQESLSDGAKKSFTRILEDVSALIEKRKIPFEGFLSWYVETVKLDLEADRTIRRDTRAKPQTYSLIG